MPTIPLMPHSKPWLVALFRGNKYYACAGALIGRYSVLTAAHCCMVSKAALGAHCYDEIRLEEMTSIVSFQSMFLNEMIFVKIILIPISPFTSGCDLFAV